MDAAVLRGAGRSLVRGSTYLRWVYLLLGAALVLAFILVDSALVATCAGARPAAAARRHRARAGRDRAAAAGCSALLPAVREVEGIAVESLLGVRFEERPLGPARNWSQRRRTAAWFCLHLLDRRHRRHDHHDRYPARRGVARGTVPDARRPRAGPRYPVPRQRRLERHLAAGGRRAVLRAAASCCPPRSAHCCVRWAPARTRPDRGRADRAAGTPYRRHLPSATGWPASCTTASGTRSAWSPSRRPPPAGCSTPIRSSPATALAAMEDVGPGGAGRPRPRARPAPRRPAPVQTRRSDARRRDRGWSRPPGPAASRSRWTRPAGWTRYRRRCPGRRTGSSRRASPTRSGTPAWNRPSSRSSCSIRTEPGSLRLELTNPVGSARRTGAGGGGRGLAGIRERVAVLRGIGRGRR